MFHVLLLVLFGFAWFWVCIFLHELAHFSVGRSLGLAPYALLVGRGPRLFEARWRGMAVRLHLYPSYGMTFSPTRRPDTAIWRDIAYFSAGLVSDALMFTLLLHLFSAGYLDGSNRVFAHAMIFGHLGYMVTNLYPRDLNLGGRIIPNDGTLIWNYLRGGAAFRAERYRRLHDNTVRRYEPGYNPGDEPGSAWTDSADPAMVNLYYQACAANEAGDTGASIGKFTALLDAAPAMHPGERAMLLDTAASTVLFTKSQALYSRAIAWAAEGCALLPACPTLHGTHGALLVENAAVLLQQKQADAHASAQTSADALIENGLALLLPLTEEGQAPSDQMIAAHYIAQAHALRGQARQAAEWERRARSGSPSPAPWANQSVRPLIRIAAALFTLCGVLACGIAIDALFEGDFESASAELFWMLPLIAYMTILFANVAMRGRAPASWLPWK